MVVVKGSVENVFIQSNSGMGQSVARCPSCKTAVWSSYGAAKEAVYFIRVGTLNNPDSFPPDIHIFTSTKQNWVQLGSTIPVVTEYYQRSKYWPKNSVIRYKNALKAKQDNVCWGSN